MVKEKSGAGAEFLPQIMLGKPALARQKKKARLPAGPLIELDPGDVLLSHAVAHAVPSALRGLTSVFGMGTGVALSLLPPGKIATE